jgi:hypothetical protein
MNLIYKTNIDSITEILIWTLRARQASECPEHGRKQQFCRKAYERIKFVEFLRA